LNQYNPFLSTGDTPHHALKYAYGLKIYGGKNEEEKLENKRKMLHPRWRLNGRAERPYVGKVYVTLHPVKDYLGKNKPNNIPELFSQGRITMGNVIVQEKETSFFGYLPGGRLLIQHKAKYLSFNRKYQKRYQFKYGIGEELYSLFRRAFLKYAPHTKERIFLETLLGQYLCSYQEICLIDEIKRIAQEKNNVLVYKDRFGHFVLGVPDAIPYNKDAWRVLEKKKKEIQQLVREQLAKKKAKLSNLTMNHNFFSFKYCNYRKMRIGKSSNFKKTNVLIFKK
jgi:hypothetical protein